MIEPHTQPSAEMIRYAYPAAHDRGVKYGTDAGIAC